MDDRDDKQQPNDTAPLEDEGEVFEWVVHPVRRKPLVSAAVTVFIFVIVAFVYYSTDSRAFALLAAVILLMSLARFYFPTKYRFTDKRVMVKTALQTLSKEWSIYRSFYPDKNGVLLSPFVRRTRLENFRGLYVMFEGNRDEVVAFVSRHIQRDDDEEDVTDSAGDKD